MDITIFESFLPNTLGYISHDKTLNLIIIIFRGSRNWVNWVENLSSEKIDWNNNCSCQVHLGFKTAYLSLKNQAD